MLWLLIRLYWPPGRQRETERQTHRQTEMERQRDRDRDNQTQRQRETETGTVHLIHLPEIGWGCKWPSLHGTTCICTSFAFNCTPLDCCPTTTLVSNVTWTWPGRVACESCLNSQASYVCSRRRMFSLLSSFAFLFRGGVNLWGLLRAGFSTSLGCVFTCFLLWVLQWLKYASVKMPVTQMVIAPPAELGLQRQGRKGVEEGKGFVPA